MSQLTEIQSAQQSLEECFTKKMDELQAQLQNCGVAKNTVAKVAEEFRTFRELIYKMLGILRKQIAECSQSVDILESRQRRKTLIFCGVKEVDKENCTAIVLNIVKNQLGLKDITESASASTLGCFGGNENLVDFLIYVGSPIDAVDDTDTTPLILASSAGRVEVVKLLLSKGAYINKKTSRGQSSLHYACSKGHIQVAKLLLDYEADVNITDILGATPLHRAAAQGRSNIVELLLSSPQIQVDLCDSTGSTPLHAACEEDREVVACMLVKAGASMLLTNKEKKTPLDFCSNKLKNMLSTLLE